MKRISSDVIQKTGTLFFYEGAPFSGVLYEKRENENILPWVVESGEIKERYISPYFDIQDDVPHIELTDDASEVGRLMHDGGLFSGVAYSFDNGFCCEEYFFLNGEAIVDICWGGRGDLISYERVRGDITETYEWHDNGRIKSYKANTADSFFGFLKFSADGLLEGVGGYRGFVGKLHELLDDAKSLQIGIGNNLFSSACSSELKLIGADIGDDFLDGMIKSGALSSVETLLIVDTSVTHDGIFAVCSEARIKKISIKEDDEGRRNDLIGVSHSFPEVDIKSIY
ncbi:hypothetical protein Bsp3421_000048 (plasmid) [Burkholderia sp. FERM BP-3421]|uniref:hypothetical protein n=1 Tax=Burkholderia sp. FERM BP-3421 TaxID=1494466 RepID=UPI002360CFBA|nr:hypothetical protein [Burkholderia sp. FERM BP-3421]WDD90228.1 hypothetical protein Bsp3421_000048 [Burkholderia sp. FERM BP-3421]